MGDGLIMLARLNEETRPDHAEADADLDRYLLSDAVTIDSYRLYLARLYGFLIPLEAAMFQTPRLGEFLDLRARAKSHLVVRDLHALGMTPMMIGALPQCDAVPVFHGVAAALGWMYVVERPLLASAVIKGHLGASLPREMRQAASYLACYEGRVGSAWRELGEAMDTLAVTSQMADRIIGAARDGFRCLRRWRTIELDAERQMSVC
jgi:heme oxygenase